MDTYLLFRKASEVPAKATGASSWDPELSPISVPLLVGPRGTSPSVDFPSVTGARQSSAVHLAPSPKGQGE